MGRANWHYGNHPPACTCVSCAEARRAAADHQGRAGIGALIRRLLARVGIR